MFNTAARWGEVVINSSWKLDSSRMTRSADCDLIQLIDQGIADIPTHPGFCVGDQPVFDRGLGHASDQGGGGGLAG